MNEREKRIAEIAFQCGSAGDGFQDVQKWLDCRDIPPDPRDTRLARLLEICGEYWQTLCHYDHDDISTSWEQYADGAEIPPKDERYAQMCRELDEARQDLVAAQCDRARLKGLLREARGYVYGAACDVRERGEEMDIAYENPAADLHARIDAELEDDHEEL